MRLSKVHLYQDIYDGLTGSLGHKSQPPAKDIGIKFTFSWWGVG